MATGIAQAVDFFALWTKICDQHHTVLFDDWDHRKAYTAHVFNGPESIIAKIADGFGMKSHSEYYHTDEILFTECDLVPAIQPNQVWVRRIRIAFEHEHDFTSGLYQEISHLMILDCDLRVLVSYPGNKDELNFQLDYLHTVVSGSDRSCQISDMGSLLLIVGWRNFTNQSIDWRGYIYRSGGWQEL